MNAIEQQLNPPPISKSNRLSTKEAAELLGVHRLTLAQYRDQHWQEGIHYFPQTKECLYNRELIDDWQQNRTNPSIHQRAIDLWLIRSKERSKFSRAISRSISRALSSAALRLTGVSGSPRLKKYRSPLKVQTSRSLPLTVLTTTVPFVALPMHQDLSSISILSSKPCKTPQNLARQRNAKRLNLTLHKACNG
jgi:hypothetical protein